MRQLKKLGGAAFVFLALATHADVAVAQLTTREAAALLVFPKVIADGTWETTIQLSNTANRPARALCHYVNGALTFLDQPPGPSNPPLWAQVDFTLFLTPQQPTQWVTSRGRSFDPTDERCNSPLDDCDGTGIDPGNIPPLPSGFTGELVCFETDASGAAWSGNAFTGHATLTHLDSGEVVKLPAIGARGFPTNDADGTLCLGGEPQEGCPLGGEYDACAEEWLVSHPTDFDDRAVDGEASRTTITVVPCGQDFETQLPTELVLQLQVVNGFEQFFSGSARVNCWTDLVSEDIGALFSRDLLGGDWVLTRIRAARNSPGGFTVAAQTVRETAKPQLFTAVATVSPQGRLRTEADLIRVPVEGIP